MSGFVGIVNLDDAPVDRDLLCRLTESIRYRGPDAQDTWTRGNIAFGHTMLRTTFEAAREHQPCSLGSASNPDNECWITADCRIDEREDLIRALVAHGRAAEKDVTDPELILHAYAVWGTDCVQHLSGDFAFAIWDGINRRLFCARDRLGIKLFYYAKKGNCLIVGNTVNCLRLHPAVTDRLNDDAIGDFLLFGSNQKAATTSFEDIRCLPPAHTMIWSGIGSAVSPSISELRIERYWTLPVDPLLHYRRHADYTEHFLDLLRTSLRDRLRTNQVGIFLSGGLDSAGIAAIAKELAGEPPSIELHAHTTVFDRLIPDEERHYAGITAAHLRIPIHFHARDDDRLYEAEGREAPSPDPAFVSVFGPDDISGAFGAMGRHARVALYGEGPDNALYYEWKSYFRHELAQGRSSRLLREIVAFPFLFREVPFLGRLTSSRRERGPAPGRSVFPAWLNPDFARRLRLEDRFEGVGEASGEPNPVHPAKPNAHASFLTHCWRTLFEIQDAGVTRVPLEFRHPYLDIRMLRYLLAVPVIPWCRNKYLMRRALRPYLPPAIVSRPKTGVPGVPQFVSWERAGRPKMLPSEAVSEYVDTRALASANGNSPTAVFTNFRPKTLDLFLRNLRR